MSPAGLDDAGDVALERQLADLVAAQTELAERPAGATRQLAAVALARRVGVARQLLQLQTRGIAVLVRLLGVVGSRLQLVVLLRVLGDEAGALQLALDQG